MRRDGSREALALGLDKVDRSPLPENGSVIHNSMVMEPLGKNFNLIGSPASVSDVSDGVNGNPVSPFGQNAQWHTPSILDRASANINGQHRASFGPLEGETLVCVQCSEDPDLSKVDRDPTHSPVQPLLSKDSSTSRGLDHGRSKSKSEKRHSV
ncbi:hypothetical protein Nepgr_033684 [Nepenthes gracilis]|uniref:Uncharacterized protein n=1 Tax=Nepenthes gracilis TaxID=150966 RepID=A0AAD3TLM0_NEPGR|nr:hypothetical protein Nepgr_033684 [Nepenthes gracilis]